MLIIRKEQMAVFQPIADDLFVRRVAEHLRNDYADSIAKLPDGSHTVAQIPDETLEQLVRGGIARARKYGIGHESSLAAFVAIMFETAPNFDEHPLLQRMLKDTEVEPDARIELLLQKSTEENWQAVKAAYDVDAWGLPDA